MTKKLTFLSFLGDKDRHNPLSVAVQVDITPWIIIPLVNLEGFLVLSSHSLQALEDFDCAGVQAGNTGYKYSSDCGKYNGKS